EKLTITNEDFKEALKETEPSAMREVLVEIPDVSWDDIGGMSEVKQEIVEAIEWPLMDPEKFTKMGIRPPKAVLLFGAPGTGKTLIAKAVASQSGANFISVKGPELLSKWVGESEKAVREIFRRARQVSPSIIFFDEIDAMTSVRGGSEGSKVSEQVVNQLLSEMDGLEKLEDVIVIGATNRPDIIDPALLRPGRFDRIVLVGSPDREGRLEIIKIHTSKMPLSEDVEEEELSEITNGYVGSDIEALCREAAMFTLREDGEMVEMRHFREALKKVRPSVTENMVSYYERIKEEFESKSGTESKSYIGFG
ncbi:MAG: AAA family ATPase, partial [Halobacteriota archaeon]|nr:AAA family ATPase [Halobacteriota archaeon]